MHIKMAVRTLEPHLRNGSDTQMTDSTDTAYVFPNDEVLLPRSVGPAP